MRIVIISWAVLMFAGAGLAQYPPMALVQIEIPAVGCIVVMHPTQPARVFLPDGNEWFDFEVRIGQSGYDHWGDCWYDEPLADAEFLIVQTWGNVDGLAVLDTPLPLEDPPAADGWTTVDFMHLRGGGHSDQPVVLQAYIPDYSLCYLHNSVTLTLRSTDINGDLIVNLTDIVLFTQVLGGEYRSYADFRPDGVINLSDIVAMAQALFDY
jgi:hypothetical protein